MKEVLATFQRRLSAVLRAICVALFALLVWLVTWQVFTRLVLENPSAWSEEASRYAFIWASLIGIAIAVGEKADVVMDFLVEKLPLAWQRVADILAYLTTLAFVLYVMVFGGSEQVSLAWSQTNPVLPFTQGQLYLVLPISGVLLTLYLTLHIVHACSRDYRGRSEIHVDEAAAGA